MRKIVCLVILLFSFTSSFCHAQRVIFHVGPAKVQNINYQNWILSYGIAFEIDIAEYASFEVNYQRWTGENNNLRFILDTPAWVVGKGYFNANQSFGMLLRYALYQNASFRFAVGGGLSAYAFTEVEIDSVNKQTFQLAQDLSLLGEWSIDKKWFVRVEPKMGFDIVELGNFEAFSDWLFLHVGVGFKL